MFFDITKFPVSENGEQCKGPDQKPIDFRGTFVQALIGDSDANGQPIRGEEKYKRYDMYVKMKKSPALAELTAEDVVFLKKVCLDAFPSIIAGQCRDFLSEPIPDAIIK
jgi:hypothetical protein